MPRQSREKSASGIYHIMVRGVNKQNIFEEAKDKEEYIERLKRYKKKSGFELYGYCLMDNHIHLLIKEGNEDVPAVMKKIGTSYVYWYNVKYERTGHLFQDRYKSEAVENDEYLLTVLRYIHQNPLKAGKAKDLEEYEWTSYKEYISEKKIIDCEFVMKMFSEKDEKEAVKRYKEFMKENSNDEFLDIRDEVRVKDEKVKEMIRKYGRVKNLSDFQKMESSKRNAVIRKIKQKKGVSTRQIARLTGFSQSAVARA